MHAVVTPSVTVSIVRVLVAFVLGGWIGWEREHHVHTAAGIRTYSLLCIGSCIFGLMSIQMAQNDPSRIAAQVVSGIGFLGAGVIFRQGSSVAGLTSAATIWSTAAIGLSIAFGNYTIAVLGTLITFFLLFLPRLDWWKNLTRKKIDIKHKDHGNDHSDSNG